MLGTLAPQTRAPTLTFRYWLCMRMWMADTEGDQTRIFHTIRRRFRVSKDLGSYSTPFRASFKPTMSAPRSFPSVPQFL